MVCGNCTAYDLVECVACAMNKRIKDINLHMQSGKLSVNFQIKVMKINYFRELLTRKSHT